MEYNDKAAFEATLPPRQAAPGTAPKARPLEGYVVADFANVIAGPACGRMFAELGATVYKLGPGLPQHGPSEQQQTEPSHRLTRNNFSLVQW